MTSKEYRRPARRIRKIKSEGEYKIYAHNRYETKNPKEVRYVG
jgi:hypothetical protein